MFFFGFKFLQATCHNSQVTSSYHEYCCTGAEVGQQIGTLLLVGVAAQGREGGPFWAKFFLGERLHHLLLPNPQVEHEYLHILIVR